MINYSIIIPHYNIPDLLMRCLRSIPVREDIQVIVVDDCSPCQEDVFRMLEELNRPYLEYYSTPIGGSAGRARNVGLDHAKGKWLIFADADDFFDENFEQILDEHVEDTEDFLFFNVRSVFSEDITCSTNRDERSSMIADFKRTGDNVPIRACCPPPWGKMIKKELIGSYNIRFDETRWSNDQFFSAVSGIKASHVKVIDEVLYVVTERQGSLSFALRQHDNISCVEECLVRLKIAVKTQHMLDKNQVIPPFRIYLHYAMLLLHKYPKHFILNFPCLFFEYPSIGMSVIRHWWRQKMKL